MMDEWLNMNRRDQPRLQFTCDFKENQYISLPVMLV